MRAHPKNKKRSRGAMRTPNYTTPYDVRVFHAKAAERRDRGVKERRGQERGGGEVGRKRASGRKKVRHASIVLSGTPDAEYVYSHGVEEEEAQEKRNRKKKGGRKKKERASASASRQISRKDTAAVEIPPQPRGRDAHPSKRECI